MSRHAWIALAVLAFGLSSPFTKEDTCAAGEGASARSMSFGRITRVEPATKEAQKKDPSYLGNIFVMPADQHRGQTAGMWLRITKRTKVLVGTQPTSAPFPFGQGQLVEFDALVTNLMLPATAYPTEVRVVGFDRNAIDPEKLKEAVRHALR